MSGIPELKPYSMPVFSQLPANVAMWQTDPNRAVLLIHDMQRFFVRKIPSENLRSTLVKNTAIIRERCKLHDVPVAYTAQSGSMTDDQRGLLKDFWGPGMKAKPEDRKVVDELAPESKDWLVTKWRYSAFYQSDLLERMRHADRDQLIICGVYAHIGVLMSAVDAFTNDIQTFLVADGIADFSKSHHLMTLDYAASTCAVNIIAEEVLL